MQIHQVAPKTKKQKRQIYRPRRKTRHLFGRGIKGQKARAGRKNEAGDKRFDKEAAQKERLPIQVVPKRFGHRES